MTEKQLIRELLSLRGWSQQKLAEEAGFKYQSNIGSFLREDARGVRSDLLIKMLNAMGCEIIVRDKMGSKKEWILSPVSEPKPESKTIEQQLTDGEITFEQAVKQGWKPSPEMLTRMLGGE